MYPDLQWQLACRRWRPDCRLVRDPLQEQPVDARMLAMGVNDDAGHLTPHGVLGFIVGTPPGACSLLQKKKPAETLIRGHH